MMEIHKTKVLIYALTFLAYAFSGYGSGILTSLRDAVIAAEHTFGDIFENVIAVAKKFKDVRDVLDAAVEEECTFSCPSGSSNSLK